MSAKSTSPMMILGKDINGYINYTLPFTPYNYSATLAPSTDTTLIVPVNFEEWHALIVPPPGSELWVATNAVASNPAGASFALTNSTMNPVMRVVYKGDTLHFFSLTSIDVSVSFYAVR